jgi:hypothetical protein
LGIGLAGVHFEDPYGLLEDPAALRATEPHEAIAADASGQRKTSSPNGTRTGNSGVNTRVLTPLLRFPQ